MLTTYQKQHEKIFPFHLWNSPEFYQVRSEALSQLKFFFPRQIIERKTYADEMLHQEKAHQHIMLAIESRQSSQSINSSPRDELARPVPFYLMENQKECSVRGSLDVSWCVSEILRTLFVIYPKILYAPTCPRSLILNLFTKLSKSLPYSQKSGLTRFFLFHALSSETLEAFSII